MVASGFCRVLSDLELAGVCDEVLNPKPQTLCNYIKVRLTVSLGIYKV